LYLPALNRPVKGSHRFPVCYFLGGG